MVVTVFDTLAYAKKLQAAGVTKESAEAQAEALAEVVCDRLATKDEISEVRKGIAILEEVVNDRIDSSFERILNQLTIRLSSITIAGFILLATLIKVF